jgi:Cdc6-like AAA superfamily ATPase
MSEGGCENLMAFLETTDLTALNLEPKKPTITQVENAFRPAKEIDDPERFAGRKDAVQQAYYGLVGEGTHIAIVGNRGIGKTSLARQIVNIASGDNDLLAKLELKHDRKLDFLAIYLTCGGSIADIRDLLERLLTSSSCLSDWIYDIPTASKVMQGFTPKAGGNLFGFALEVSGEKKSELTSESAGPKHQVDAVFTNVVIAMTAQGLATDGLLIVVDEFDQIADPKGFASFLKSLATNAPKVRFCIVGVAQDIQNLMKEHESTDRLFAGAIIPLPSMTDPELREIVAIAEKSVDHYIQFDEEALVRLTTLAHGHPYMVHLIGKYAFRHAYMTSRRKIDLAMVNEAMQSIAERQYDPVLEGRYKKAVASSEQREVVLKAMANSQAADGEIWTTDAYKVALDQGVDNASQFVGQLVTNDYGGEIEKVRERYYRFHDSLFAAYVSARPKLIEKRGMAQVDPTSSAILE